MYFLHIVFVVVCILFLQIQLVKAEAGPDESPNPDAVPGDPEPKDPEQDSAEYYEDKLAHVDSHTFVTLIDIVFTDSSKKTCTGAIIADHAVITAAHCTNTNTKYKNVYLSTKNISINNYMLSGANIYSITRNEDIQPELTLSFVILGTKKMFESGYESYLPIERIETHPNFKGWTADLAIVFTFAGMVTEKPGTIVPLAGERSSTPVDSNVTVFSWGHCSEGTSKKGPVKQAQETVYPPDTEEGNTEYAIIQHPTKIRANMKSKSFPYNRPMKKQMRSGSMDNSNYQVRFNVQKVEPYTVVRAQKKRRLKLEGTTKNSGSRYLSDIDDTDEINAENYRRNRRFKTRSNNENRRRPSDPQEIDENSTDRNGRRLSEPQSNNLTIEVFGFVNAQTCKKLVDRSVPPLYSIQNKNEVLCYASDLHYITVEDSGAPALQHGKLVAVTVGGVESGGEHVAVGMKMSCFCSWIVDTLPMYEELVKIKCCKNCCDVKHSQAQEFNINPGDADQLPKRPGRKGKSNQRYRVADAEDNYDNE